MKLSILIDTNKEEKIEIVAHKMTPKIEKIKDMFEDENLLTCYKDDIVKKVNLYDVVVIFTNNNHVYVSTNEAEYLTKYRLYQLEEQVDEDFLKINKGCLVNIKEIDKFNVSFNAQLKVEMKNGFSDYVARRELKEVKRRLGL